MIVWPHRGQPAALGPKCGRGHTRCRSFRRVSRGEPAKGGHGDLRVQDVDHLPLGDSSQQGGGERVHLWWARVPLTGPGEQRNRGGGGGGGWLRRGRKRSWWRWRRAGACLGHRI